MHVKALHEQLHKLGIPLVILDAPLYKDIPVTLSAFMHANAATHLYMNDEYVINERKRDKAVRRVMGKHGIVVTSYTDHLLFTPGDILTQAETVYSIFTPFKRACYKQWHLANTLIFPAPKAQKYIEPCAPNALKIETLLAQFPANTTMQIDADWLIGESSAHELLLAFLDEAINDYDVARDYPAMKGTSRLSAYLNVGAISIRKCFMYAHEQNKFELSEGNKGIATWLNELLWREFYFHVAVGFSRVCKHKAFKTATDTIMWNTNLSDLERWKTGKTGVPIVDAGMRQLAQTGWMHNRVRMICAMFLTKNLLMDWREGEKWFMEQLVDASFPANNGGWQWSASTGTDAAPYFRIFNPHSQSIRFDKGGDYIRKFVPELAGIQGKNIHNPTGSERLLSNYPEQMVDLKLSRQVAIDVFRQLGA